MIMCYITQFVENEYDCLYMYMYKIYFFFLSPRSRILHNGVQYYVRKTRIHRKRHFR
jgi:hypothetical protein